jgi:hypothetical protein
MHLRVRKKRIAGMSGSICSQPLGARAGSNRFRAIADFDTKKDVQKDDDRF